MRSTQERNTRLENMCWRIWNLARKKKQVFIYIYIYINIILVRKKCLMISSCFYDNYYH